MTQTHPRISKQLPKSSSITRKNLPRRRAGTRQPTPAADAKNGPGRRGRGDLLQATKTLVARLDIRERPGRRSKCASAEIAFDLAGPPSRHPGVKGKSPPKVSAKDIRGAAKLLAAVGHPVRIKVLTHALRGPCVYRDLCRISGTASGPLYFHLNRLQITGLIRVVERDLYELTDVGRSLIAGALVVTRFVRQPPRGSRA